MDNVKAFLGIREVLANFLQEDIGAGDITSDAIIPVDLKANAEVLSKSRSAIVCGLEEASILFDICGCKTEVLVKDGSKVLNGTTVMNVSGCARAILKTERTALNLIMRMSGIATETRKIADLAKGVTILATRKTAPGLRYFDKKAVVLGGGSPHRMRLDDMVLIKDNHLALSSDPEECIRLSRKKIDSSIKIECEAKSKEEALKVVSAGADLVMLDNFTPELARKTIEQITKMGKRKDVMIELSGRINQRNIQDYLQAKPDFISLGSITHSPRAADFSLEIRK
jgi:nicotinate-nucleotide pyrophosphorylase (carboxylating)